MPGRILWGWMGSALVSPRVMLGALALGMAASTVLVGLSGAHWPVLALTLAASGLSITALSWHGVLLAESARLATQTSPSRRAAYEAGTYRPRRHGLIWSRADLLAHYP